jgi:hypothetical protein
MESLEMKRTQRLDEIYKDAENRLMELRNELARTERTLEQTKSLSVEEERRITEKRGMLRTTMEELASIEHAIMMSNRKLNEDRQKSMFEISQLDLAKQQAKSHMFLVAEAEKRLAPNHSTLASTWSTSGLSRPSASVSEYESGLDDSEVRKDTQTARRRVSPGLRTLDKEILYPERRNKDNEIYRQSSSHPVASTTSKSSTFPRKSFLEAYDESLQRPEDSYDNVLTSEHVRCEEVNEYPDLMGKVEELRAQSNRVLAGKGLLG